MLDEFDMFAGKRSKQTLLYNLLDALQTSGMQVGAEAPSGEGQWGGTMRALALARQRRASLTCSLPSVHPSLNWAPAHLSPPQAAVVGLTVRQDVVELLEKRVKSRFRWGG